MNFFKRRSILKKLNYLEATPVRKCEYTIGDDNLVILSVPKFKNEKFNRWFLNQKKRYFTIHLDEIGTVVWQQIDGHTKVQSVCDKSEEILGEKIQPVVQRVTKFLTMLYNARYITFKEIEE